MSAVECHRKYELQIIRSYFVPQHCVSNWKAKTYPLRETIYSIGIVQLVEGGL